MELFYFEGSRLPLFRRCLTIAVCSHFWEKALIQCTSFFMQLKTLLKKAVERFQNGRYTYYKASLYPQGFYHLCSFISIALKISVWPNECVMLQHWSGYVTWHKGKYFGHSIVRVIFTKRCKLIFLIERQDIRGLTCWGICQLLKRGEYGMTIVHQTWFQNCKCEASLGRCCSST